MKSTRIWLVTLGVLLISKSFFSQKNSIKIIFLDTTHSPICVLKTSADRKLKTVIAYRNKLISKGFLLANISPLDSTHFMVTKGKRFSSFSLKKTGGKEINIEPREYSRYLSTELERNCNRGYPFFSIQLDSLIIAEENLSASIVEEPGPYVTWQKLYANSDSSISENMLENLTGIRKGEQYQESKLIQLTNRLSQYNYLEFIKPSEVLFTDDGAELFTYVRYKKMSSLQGAIGLQPNPVTQRLGLTGELQLRLTNVLKRAELIDINWRSVQLGTSNLNARCAIPFLFQSPFGIDAKLQLYKRDSTFLELKSLIAIQYSLQNGTLIKGVYQLYNSNTLNASSSNLLFPRNAQIQTHFFGIQFQQKHLDNLFNPRKGFTYLLDGAVGNRTSSVSTESLKSTVYRFQGDFEYFQPLFKRHTIKLGIQAETYLADSIYSNERIRVGGLNSIRGFNEEAIFATTKFIGTFEYRFLIDRLSYVFTFIDQGYMQDLSLNMTTDTPTGIGIGFAYGTKLGTFALVGAMGKFKNQPFDYREVKIHFGYTAYF